MDQIWIAAAAGIAAVALGVPFVAIVLVTIASRREEAAHSLSRQAPGPVARAARRLLAFRTETLARAQDRAASYATRAGRERRPSRDRRPGGGRRSAGSGPRPRALDLVSAAPAALAPGHDAIGAREVRFVHARRSLSDAGQYQAGRESQPRSVRADQRQGAGV